MFTVALLKDTGYYQDINENFSSNIYWGKGRGCDFYNNVCRGVYSYPEFVKDDQTKGCTYENEGIGIGKSGASMDGCFYTMSYGSKLCINDENN